MVLDTKKEKFCVKQSIIEKELAVQVSEDIIIPDTKPDIISAVNSCGNVCVYKKDILDGKIRLDGSINVYVMYIPDAENNCVHSINSNLDFTELIDIEQARQGMNSTEKITIKSIECKVLNGRKVNISVLLNIKTKLYTNDEINIIGEVTNCPDAQFLNKSTNVITLIGSGSNKLYAKENLKIDEIDNLMEVLKVNFNIVNAETKISYNKVLIKADLDVNVLYLTDDNRINCVKSTIPIMGFIDIQNVNEDNVCNVDYTIQNILIKQNSVEEHSIYVEVQLEAICMAYKLEQVNIIQDLYSPKYNINFTSKRLNVVSNKRTLKNECQINETLNIPELGNGRLYNVDITPNILSANLANGKIIYNGDIELNFLFEANNVINFDSRSLRVEFNSIVDIRRFSFKFKY